VEWKFWEKGHDLLKVALRKTVLNLRCGSGQSLRALAQERGWEIIGETASYP
jgi:cyclopropane fatty-acyl-phospholipid synthase-like methyltransferase